MHIPMHTYYHVYNFFRCVCQFKSKNPVSTFSAEKKLSELVLPFARVSDLWSSDLPPPTSLTDLFFLLVKGNITYFIDTHFLHQHTLLRYISLSHYPGPGIALLDHRTHFLFSFYLHTNLKFRVKFICTCFLVSTLKAYRRGFNFQVHYT